MSKWGMVIDLRKCINCKICEVVCSQTNMVPERSRRKVFDFGPVDDAGGIRISFPMSCMQCENPPCLNVCPTTATYQRSDGIVGIDNELCIGCGYCIVGCPYNARSIIEEESSNDPGVESFLGICTKCDFCVTKVDDGLERGLRPGIDPEATPSCVNSCTTNALHFGDLNDPESEVSRLVRDEKAERLHEDMGTESSVYYILPEGYTLSSKET